MIINGSILNATLINGVDITGPPTIGGVETITSTLDFSEVYTLEYHLSALLIDNLVFPNTFTGIKCIKILNTYNLSSEVVSYLSKITIIESLILSSKSTTSVEFINIINSYLVLTDNLLILLKENITDTLSLDSITTLLKKSIEKVISKLVTTTITNNNVEFINLVTNLLRLVDSINNNAYEIINDSLVVDEVLSSLYKYLSKIIDDVIFSSNLNPSTAYILSLENNISLDDSDNTTSLLNNSLLDSIFFYLPEVSTDHKYITYNYSTEYNSVTEYSNYNFIGSARVNDKYVFINSNGLYEYGGIFDETTPITSSIATSAMSFKSSNLKQVPTIYLGISNSGIAYLKVKVDGKGEIQYRLNKFTNNLQTQRVEIGKGLIGRYFQFELVTSADTFDLESIDFSPIELKRKI